MCSGRTGTPFKAEDVVFTYEFVANAEVGATTAGAYERVESVEAIDDYTVKVNFKDVNPAWFLMFMGSEGMILPKHIFAAYNGSNARESASQPDSCRHRPLSGDGLQAWGYRDL